MNMLNKFKRGLAALLSLSVAMSAVFVFHFPLMKAYADSEHKHSVDGKGESIEWTEWTKTDCLPGESDITDEDGNENHYFYLTGNVTIESTWEPEDGTYLCLNGCTITMTGNDNAVSVWDSFTLCDCKDNKGTITHAEGCNDGAGVYNKGTFNMYGGEISGNNATGVYNNGTMTLGGTAKITGNGTGGNVYLPNNFTINIDEDDPLRSGAEIGITTCNDPSGSSYISVTDESDDDYREFFKSDNSKFSIKINNKNAIVLAEIQGAFGDHSAHGICGHTDCGSDYANVDWEEWSSTYKLPETSGYYFLEHDVLLNKTWVPANDTHICMNDNSIKMNNDGTAISVENGSLTLCNGLNLDSEIVHINDNTGSGICVKSGCELAIYDITITDNLDYGVEVESGGVLTVGSKANVTGNTKGNVYLHNDAVINIDGKDPLKENAAIGITTAPDANRVTINGNGATGFIDHFSADENGSCSLEPGEDGSFEVVPKEPGGSENDPPSTGGNPALADDHSDHETWKEISSADDLEREDGDSCYYVLTQDVELEETWIPANGTVLCLNGQKLTKTGSGAAISVPGGVTFSLCDCTDKGVTGEQGAEAGAITSGGSVVEIDGGSFEMYSGKIFGGNGANGVTFTENGGTITVGGTAKIMSDVVLPSGKKTITVSSDKPLKENAMIYVSTATELAENDPVDITGNNGDKDYSGFFHTAGEDDEDYNYEFKTAGGKVVLAVKGQEIPDKDHDPHGDDDKTEWKELTTTLPTENGHYYLTQNVTIPADWAPEQGTYICLNGHTISGTIPNSNVTLSNCKTKGEANITLSEGAKINVDNFIGGKIRVTIKELGVGESLEITTANNGAYRSCFESTQGYFVDVDEENGAVKFTNTGKPPVVDPPVDPTKHIHPICGDIDCRARHNAPAEWTAWESASALPAASGSYYLTKDVELPDTWEIPNGTDIELCLNGRDITLKNNGENRPVVKIDNNASLILCDCAMYPNGSNTIANNLASAISAAYVRNQLETLGMIGGSSASGVENGGSFMMFGGVITNNGSSGVRNSSDFVMNGGVIIGNSASNGGGVYNRGFSSTSASFTMEGGVIADNHAANIGGGLYNAGVAVIKDGRIIENSAEGEGGGVYQDGALTVDHSAYISRNKVGSSANNVFLPDGRKINIGASLSGTVGVTLEKNPTGSGKVNFATGTINSSTPNKIKSDNSSYIIKTSGGALALYRNTSSSGSSSGSSSSATTHDWELDITSKTASQIPKADREVILELLKTMPDWLVGAYYDVTLYEDDEEVSESARLLDVELTIPTSIRAANRQYKVIRVHDGKATLLDDIDSDPNTVTVRSRYFSTYAVIYSISKSGSANGTNGTSSNGGYGNPAMGVQNDIPIAGLACGFTALALAAPGKKFEQ